MRSACVGIISGWVGAPTKVLGSGPWRALRAAIQFFVSPRCSLRATPTFLVTHAALLNTLACCVPRLFFSFNSFVAAFVMLLFERALSGSINRVTHFFDRYCLLKHFRNRAQIMLFDYRIRHRHNLCDTTLNRTELR